MDRSDAHTRPLALHILALDAKSPLTSCMPLEKLLDLPKLLLLQLRKVLFHWSLFSKIRDAKSSAQSWKSGRIFAVVDLLTIAVMLINFN